MADEKQTKYIFGIDLGTTYSVISYLDDNMMIQTCSNQEGSDITPSCRSERSGKSGGWSGGKG